MKFLVATTCVIDTERDEAYKNVATAADVERLFDPRLPTADDAEIQVTPFDEGRVPPAWEIAAHKAAGPLGLDPEELAAAIRLELLGLTARRLAADVERAHRGGGMGATW